jgi:hypothetical protein
MRTTAIALGIDAVKIISAVAVAAANAAIRMVSPVLPGVADPGSCQGKFFESNVR